MNNEKKNTESNILIKIAKWFGIFFVGIMIIMLVLLGYAYSKKDQILTYTLENLNKTLPTNITVQNIDFSFITNFPSFSIVLNNAEVLDSLYSAHQHKLFTAKEISLQVYVFKLLLGELDVKSILIKDAEIKLLTTKSGYSNFEFKGGNTDTLKIKKSNPKMPSGLQVDKVILENVHFRMTDSLANKWFDLGTKTLENRLVWSDTGIAVQMRGGMHWGGLAFNPKLGAYMANKDVDMNIDAFYNTSKNQVIALPSSVVIENETYLIQGLFKVAKFPYIDLRISTDEAKVGKVFTCMSYNVTSILSNIHLTNSIKAAVTISGELLPNTTPRVDCYFSSDKNVGYHSQLPLTITGISFKGRVTNQMNDSVPCDDHFSILTISNFVGRIPGVILKANALITDFITPSLALNLQTNMNMKGVNTLLPNLPFNFLDGKGLFFLQFEGNLDSLARTGEFSAVRQFDGHLLFTNSGIAMKKGNLKAEKFNTDIKFNKNNVVVKKLAFDCEGSTINLTGNAQNVPAYLLTEGENMHATIDLNSPKIDLGRILSKYASWKQATINTKKIHKKNNKKKMQLPENITAKVKLNAQVIHFNKFTASNVHGQVEVLNDNLNLSNFNLKTAKGIIELSASLNDMNSKQPNFKCIAQLKNVDVKDVFYSFNDFGQKLLGSRNLKGTLNTHAIFSTKMNIDFSPINTSMSGKLRISLKNGHLIDFEPLTNITGFLFPNRNYKDITFAELKNEFTLNGTQIKVLNMEVASNLLTFYLRGKYDFKSSLVDFHVKLPLSNLKKREKDYVPVNFGKNGPEKNNIHLKIFTGKNGKIAVLPERAKNF